MKKSILALIMFAFATVNYAQNQPAAAPTTTAPTTVATPVKKHKHEKKVKPAATATTPQAATASTTTMPAKAAHPHRTEAEKQANAATDAARDKVIGKDAAGHDIHLGPKGGQYYINEKAEKTYIKGAAKLKVG
jgi:hypothetical protein